MAFSGKSLLPLTPPPHTHTHCVHDFSELKNLTGGTLPHGALSGGADELEAALGRFKVRSMSGALLGLPACGHGVEWWVSRSW